MHRPIVFTGLMIAMLLSVFSGCGGSPEVAQNAPPPASSSSSSGSDAGSSMPPPGDSSGGQPDQDMGDIGDGGGMASGSGMGGMPMSGSGDMGMGGMPMSGSGDMGMAGADGYGDGYPGMMNGMGDMGMGSQGMGGMGMGEMGMGGMGMGGMGMGGMGMGQFTPPEDPAPAEDADYLTKGRYAFSIGKEKEAIEYAIAFAFASPEGADVLQKTKWFATALRPVTTTRFAVGVVLEAPASMTDFKPIGSKQMQGGGGGGGGMAMMGGPGSGTANNTKAPKEHAFYDLTGSFGEAVVTGFQERWTAGNFGTVYNDVEKFVPKPPVANDGMGMMGMGMMGGMPVGGMGDMGMGDMGSMGDMSGNGETASRPKIMPGSVVVPGLVYIGTAEKQADLMKKAEGRGVDLVFLFDVKVSPPNRLNGIVQNEAKVRLVSLKGDPLVRSNALTNTEVERASMRMSGDDEVAKTIDKFLAQIDTKVKLSDMPALKPEHARARLVQVLSNSNTSKLEKLFEVSLYHSLKLITDDEKLTACLIVMEGSEGESLANGRPEDKQAVLDTLLPNYK